MRDLVRIRDVVDFFREEGAGAYLVEFFKDADVHQFLDVGFGGGVGHVEFSSHLWNLDYWSCKQVVDDGVEPI